MSSRKLSLSELMGKAGASRASGGGLTLEHLPELLGENLPDLPRNAVGRHRLIRSLQQRFGSNFRSLPGVADLVKKFDDEIAFEDRVQRLKTVKYQGGSRG